MEPAIASERPPPAPPDGNAADAVLTAYFASGNRRLRTQRWLRRAELLVRLTTGAAIALALAVASLPGVDARAIAAPAACALLLGLALATRTRENAQRSVVEAIARKRADLADELASFVELRDHARDGRLSGGLAFLILLRDRLAAKIGETPLPTLLPSWPALRRLLGSIVLCATALLTTSWIAPRLMPDLWLALHAGHGILPPVTAPPIVGDVELELRPPAYTGLPTRSLPASAGDIRALPGTEVLIHARSLVGAVRSAELHVESPGAKDHILPVEVTADGAMPTLTVKLRVDHAGAYRFVLWRWSGRLAEPSAHRIELEVDGAPRVELTTPGDPLELEVPRPIELAYAVEDDFGLGEVALVWRINDGPEQRKVLDPERPTPRRARGRFVWELGELEREAPLPAGARVQYAIEAQDNDEVSGKKRARSATFNLVFHKKPEPMARDRQQLEALLEGALTALSDRLERPTAQTDAQRHAALVDLVARFGAAARAPDKGEKGTTLAFRKIAGEIAQRLGDRAAEEAHDARAAQAPIVAELERDVLALDDLRGRRRLEEMTRVGTEMKRVRDELQRLFAELKTATSDEQKAALRREIERKLTELEAKMAELRQLSSQAEGEVPDEFVNRESIEKQAMKNGVDDIRKMLEQGDLEHAAAELERMSRSLDEMSKQLDKGLQDFSGQRNPEEEKAMAQMESELFDLAKEEREIERAGRAIRERAAGEKRDLSELHAKLKPKLDELERRAGEHEREQSFGSDKDELERLRARARQIGRALDANDLDGAQEMAEDARRVTGGLSVQLRMAINEAEAEAQARVGDGPSASLRHDSKHIDETEALARDIQNTLERAEGERRPQLSDADRKQLEELARRQQSAQQRGDQLSKQLGDKAAPGMASLPEGVRGDVDGAGQAMRESSRQLARPSPGRGAEAAGQAAERLDSARKQVSDARHGGSENQSPQGKRDELVKIPGADDSAAPRAFREELMDAMKRGAPRHFEEQVKQYYEELVR